MQHAFRIKTNTPQRYAFVHGRVPPREFGRFLSDALARVWRALSELESVTVGPAIARYHGAAGATIEVDAGFPVAEPLQSAEAYVVDVLPAGRVATVIHWGSYDTIAESWTALEKWMREQQLVGGATRWEIYWADASHTADPSELRTELVWPLIDESG
ncbi:MAG: AraC family transcriptional regulator [Planctomycetota bacterium]|nr:MAG: AraC family transcriptional regulator [Planctomycetota bacterium]